MFSLIKKIIRLSKIDLNTYGSSENIANNRYPDAESVKGELARSRKELREIFSFLGIFYFIVSVPIILFLLEVDDLVVSIVFFAIIIGVLFFETKIFTNYF